MLQIIKKINVTSHLLAKTFVKQSPIFFSCIFFFGLIFYVTINMKESNTNSSF